ncbi:hypothetical protein KN63_00395 [Smithella sp. F21]|nr:hypothetical protein KN63_00395 [Smithella sp. F21]
MMRALTVLAGGMFLCVLSVGFAFAQTEGKAIVDKSCSACHGIKKVESAKKSAAEWEVTLDRMIKKGAKVKPEERDAVLKYLSTFK